jgi:hypothetical protein
VHTSLALISVQVYMEKKLIIDKSLYGLKTTAARFHDPLSDSLIQLDFKKSNDDPDLWIVDKSSITL